MEEKIYVAGGCFWGIEKILGALPGVTSTRVGYMGGHTDNPNYAQVCTGLTGHAEAVEVTYAPEEVSTSQVLATFFENHDPTQLNRQGNDVGTQYRSAIWAVSPTQLDTALRTKSAYQDRLTAAGAGEITTTIDLVGENTFWEAEEYHQKYLQKNPLGYCNHGFNGVECPSGIL